MRPGHRAGASTRDKPALTDRRNRQNRSAFARAKPRFVRMQKIIHPKAVFYLSSLREISKFMGDIYELFGLPRYVMPRPLVGFLRSICCYLPDLLLFCSAHDSYWATCAKTIESMHIEQMLCLNA